MSQTVRYGRICNALVATTASACNDSAWGRLRPLKRNFANPAFPRRVGAAREDVCHSFEGSGFPPQLHRQNHRGVKNFNVQPSRGGRDVVLAVGSKPPLWTRYPKSSVTKDL
jgi:hypothetical protein